MLSDLSSYATKVGKAISSSKNSIINYGTKAGKAISGTKNITLKNYPILKKDSTFFDDKFILKLQKETNKIKEEYIITTNIKN
jgi:hypothetical protein